ncbi:MULTISPECIES: type II secretion system protein GspL [unclassified Pseudomonas]|uniref:type II secretion system protein GspL n=1 Tax=unclassified Pseudomonas TaxID=196821 RepID=UPI0005364E54|nr:MULTISPECIES: type II secretion system protein GspL [unclassified Pseudomonas]MBD0682990.1 type II secretion system protein GspL [Pseudomonas sp. PSB18]CDF93223.1 General secretion pathway protein L [Pseudomonas sp. SHC52]
MSRLRIALAPLDGLGLDSPVPFARLDRQGQVRDAGRSTLRALGQGTKHLAVECFLHPRDSLLTSLELPPLSAAKITAAVTCAAQALMLGADDQMQVAHGPRGADGQVQVAWLDRESLGALGRILLQAGLKLRGLYPAAYALPVLSGPVACIEDGHLLVRHGLQHAVVQPLMEEALDEWLLEVGPGLHWVGESPPQGSIDTLPATQRWTGTAPGWGLHAGLTQGRGERGGWGRAAGICALALAVWVIGLNLYASRETAQGQRLKAQMSQRVKQAFPQLPLILNPLQQARQQVAARQNGSVSDPAQRFASLVQQAGSAMPFISGNVQELVFEDGELRLKVVAEAQKTAAGEDWKMPLTQAGIEVATIDQGWILRVAPVGQGSSGETPESDDE